MQTAILVCCRVGYLCAAYILRRPKGRSCYHFNLIVGAGGGVRQLTLRTAVESLYLVPVVTFAAVLPRLK